MALKLKVAPASEPVSLAEAKTYLQITDSGDDALINQWIVTLREICEQWTGRSLVTQTWTWWLDRFPTQRNRGRENSSAGYFELPVNFDDDVVRALSFPRPPLQSVTHLKTYGSDNAATLFSASNYMVDVASEPGRIVLNESIFWPTGLRPANAVEIEFVAGYGDGASVPEAIKQGMLLWIKLLHADRNWLFESGEAVAGLDTLNQQAVPQPVATLWAPFKIYSLDRS